MIALENCPCCGGEAAFNGDADGWTWIECFPCGLSTVQKVSLMEDCRPHLAEAWNQRTRPSGADSRIATLESENEALRHDIERHIANHAADLNATQGADTRPVAIPVPVPTERGIYAWIAEGSASLVLVHTRPSDHSPGGVMKATNVRNCTFYEGCPVEQWHGGAWYGPLTKDATRDAAPIPMLLFCPECGEQHIDAPEIEPGRLISGGSNAGRAVPPRVIWTNPPHKSHLCHACKTVWRPADIETTGVKEISTIGKADTWPPEKTS